MGLMFLGFIGMCLNDLSKNRGWGGVGVGGGGRYGLNGKKLLEYQKLLLGFLDSHCGKKIGLSE